MPRPSDLEDVRAIDVVPVRALRIDDVPAVVKIDRHSTGRVRSEYYDAKIRAAVAEGKLRTSLAAELDGHVVGFLVARVYFGEFGRAEPFAVVDSLGVDPDYRGRSVASALLEQLLMNLGALGVERVETQIEATQPDLLAFLARAGFRPAARVCLERDVHPLPA